MLVNFWSENWCKLQQRHKWNRCFHQMKMQEMTHEPDLQKQVDHMETIEHLGARYYSKNLFNQPPAFFHLSCHQTPLHADFSRDWWGWILGTKQLILNCVCLSKTTAYQNIDCLLFIAWCRHHKFHWGNAHLGLSFCSCWAACGPIIHLGVWGSPPRMHTNIFELESNFLKNSSCFVLLTQPHQETSLSGHPVVCSDSKSYPETNTNSEKAQM